MSNSDWPFMNNGNWPLGCQDTGSCVRHGTCMYLKCRHQRTVALSTLEESLVILGYRPEDDSWDTDGRRTYLHEGNATQARLNTVRRGLESLGWEVVKNRLRTFRDPKTCEIIEIEPGGDDCTGHYLHLMKAETANEH